VKQRLRKHPFLKNKPKGYVEYHMSQKDKKAKKLVNLLKFPENIQMH